MTQSDPARAALVLGRRLLQGLLLRLDLLELELRDEQFRFLRRLVATAAGLFFIFLGIVLINIALVVSFWDAWGQGLLWLLAVVYLLIGTGCSGYVWYKLEYSPGPFSATLRELRKDLAALTGDDP